MDIIPQSPVLCACGCGTPLTPRKDGKQQRFRKGHGRSAGEIVETTCAQCGTAITVRAWRIAKFGKAYCGYACAALARIRNVTRPCDACGAPVTFKPHRKHNPHIFCNLRCYHAWWEARPDNKILLTCAQCGAQLLKYPSYNTTNKHYFCSKACRALFIVGANNPAYTSGLGRRGEYGANWKRQRRAAVARDNATCQVCGRIPKRAKALHVHHLIPVYQFHGDYEAANQLTNLLTLCAKCHKLAEHGKIAVQAKLL